MQNSDSLLQSFSDMNNLLNNTNTYLIAISKPIIDYLLNKNDDFEDKLRDAHWNDSRYPTDGLIGDLCEKTNDLLMHMSYVSDHVDCDCHNISWAGFHQEMAGPLQEHCLALLAFVDVKKLSEKRIALSSDFGADYSAIKDHLMHDRMGLIEAEIALLYWQGAVPDLLMQEAILQLRYDYLRKLLASQPSLG